MTAHSWWTFNDAKRQEVFGHLAEQLWVGAEGGDLPVPTMMRFGIASDGRLVCTGLVIGVEFRDPDASREQEHEVNARALRSIPLGELVASVVNEREVLEFFAPSGRVDDYERPKARPGPKGWPREHFEEVADAYRAALIEHPQAPVKTLAARWHTPEATMRRWLRRARDMELLDEAPPGRAGEQKKPRKGRR